MSTCRLIALDIDDLAVISAHLQNAVLRAGNIHWLAHEKRVAIVASRIDRDRPDEAPAADGRAAILRFDRVLSCKARALEPESPEQPLELIAIDFVPTDDPAGTVTLYFSNNATLRLEVECLECALSDVT